MTPEQRERRRRIMQRSMALGHCICAPAKPCPCPEFTADNICACAGERRPPAQGPVRLTELVRNPGCASKIGKAVLEEVLQGLPMHEDARVHIGSAAGDDAGVIELEPGLGSVLTVDVFSPAVDDPHTFGRIAAANSLSDIYAMGATPQAALSIIGFPAHDLPPSVMQDILAGGLEVMHEAGVPVIGGHSINDDEPKAGFAVLGTAPLDGIIANHGVQPGDVLVLTKPIGGGIVCFGHQIGRAEASCVAAVTSAMATVNREAGMLLGPCRAHAATDVTGFSLLGHLADMVRRSQVAVDLDVDAIPLFPGVRELARAEVLPGALERNREAIDEDLLDLDALAPAQAAALCSPETNGGLLVALSPDDAQRFIAALAEAGIAAAIIARAVAAHSTGRISARTSQAAQWATLPRPARPAPADSAAAASPCCASTCGCEAPAPAAAVAETDDCCCDASAPTAGSGPSAPATGSAPLLPLPQGGEAFAAMMQQSKAGSLDQRSSALIGLALSLVTRCATCVRIHARMARDAGASTDDVAQAVGMAIAFGGAAVNMFYHELRKEEMGE